MGNPFMEEALSQAYIGMQEGAGGPFGAVIVQDGKIIGKGHNGVLKNNDPTAHGEIEAIRRACQAINSFDLSGCQLYTTAEPCPMCLGAILWAGITEIYYGCNREDCERIGFRDKLFYDMLEQEQGYHMEETARERCLELFDAYEALENKRLY